MGGSLGGSVGGSMGSGLGGGLSSGLGGVPSTSGFSSFFFIERFYKHIDG
jgi:hypothetical protein